MCLTEQTWGQKPLPGRADFSPNSVQDHTGPTKDYRNEQTNLADLAPV